MKLRHDSHAIKIILSLNEDLTLPLQLQDIETVFKFLFAPLMVLKKTALILILGVINVGLKLQFKTKK